jgi:hypothetical protein
LSSSSEEGLALVRVPPEDLKGKTLTIYLYAKQGDTNTAKAIQDLISKKPYVSVTGILAPDGKSVQVSSISETDPPKKGKKK